MRIVLRFLVLAASLSISAAAPATASCPGLASGFSATVARVLDAETLLLHDGAQLRLAGILAPHPDDAGAAAPAWAPAVAAKAEVDLLVLGKSVSVAFGSERRDRYGRHLGHVTVEDGGAQRWLQGHLLAQGLARVVTRAQDQACEAEMLAAERGARDGGLGLWGNAAYRVRAASDLDALTALVGSFQVVEGSITGSRVASGVTRIEFSEKNRFGLVALVPRAKGSKAGDGLKGKRVRLRGWLEERSGRPTLDLSIIGTLEMLD